MNNKNSRYVQVGMSVIRDAKGNPIESTKQNLYIEINDNNYKKGLSEGEKEVAWEFAGFLIRQYDRELRELFKIKKK